MSDSITSPEVTPTPTGENALPVDGTASSTMLPNEVANVLDWWNAQTPTFKFGILGVVCLLAIGMYRR